MTEAHNASMIYPLYGSTEGGFDYRSQAYKEAWEGMRRALVTYDDVFVMTAPAGAGKTTLLANFLSEFASEDVFIATASTTDLQGGSLLDYMLSLLGIADGTPDRFFALEQVSKRLNNHTHALLAIDDAHALTDSAFKNLHELAYLRRTLGPMLQIFLVGEDPVLAKLESCELVKINLWRPESHRLAPLSRLETGEFIHGWFARLESARNPIFTAETLELIYRWSRGIPGRLIRLCHWFAHQGSDDDGRDEFGREEVCRGIRGQRGLEIVEAHASLAAHYGNVAVSLHPGEPVDDG
jgi:general secretion pathway protein A